jgi:ketosteroid isomerase-like protein
MVQQQSVSVETLEAIADAFNAHDLDAIMEFFADDCSLDMLRGPEPWGERFTGKAAVRAILTLSAQDVIDTGGHTA